jgi:hypothetical protein
MAAIRAITPIARCPEASPNITAATGTGVRIQPSFDKRRRGTAGVVATLRAVYTGTSKLQVVRAKAAITVPARDRDLLLAADWLHDVGHAPNTRAARDQANPREAIRHGDVRCPVRQNFKSRFTTVV